MKKTSIILAGIALMAVAATAVVFANPFSRVKDSYFYPDADRLHSVPAGLVILRPTHFPHEDAKIRHYHVDDSLARTVGRNASFRNMMAEAYDCNPAEIVLPPDAPQGGFDFLVTTDKHVRDHLRTAIEKNLNYTAHEETRATDAWVLTVNDPSLPGLTLSPDGEKDDAALKDGRVYLTHQQSSDIAHGLAQGLNRPVLDETGLTNYYDFSIVWNGNIQRAMDKGALDLQGTRKVLATLGLAIEATNAPMDVYVVTRTP
jgi:uncharacterized protein (TIGR03435 family)